MEEATSRIETQMVGRQVRLVGCQAVDLVRVAQLPYHQNTVINLWFHKRQRISCPAEGPLPFQERICFMELFNCCITNSEEVRERVPGSPPPLSFLLQWYINSEFDFNIFIVLTSCKKPSSQDPHRTVCASNPSGSMVAVCYSLVLL